VEWALTKEERKEGMKAFFWGGGEGGIAYNSSLHAKGVAQ